jgi:hypothetical protein
MFRAIPFANKVCFNFENEQNKKNHMKKMKEMKPAVDTFLPTTFNITNNKKKRDQLINDRFVEIDRENRILLKKITNIMENPQSI